MRRLLRRLAWLVARLMLVVAFSFLLLATTTNNRNTKGFHFSTDRLEESQLPLFLNLQPADLESRINLIVRHLAQSDSEPDVRELQRLGGASLPLLVARLPAMTRQAQCRISSALLPIALRMAWRGAEEVKGDCAYEYLVEAWRERAVDFQPNIVERWVERLASRGGKAMVASVVEYDTFALPALMAALPEVTSVEDIRRVHHLLSVIRRATGIAWTVPANAQPADAQRVVEHWQRWWQLHSIEYTVVKGPTRWSAMLKQTQFGQWITLVFRFHFGTTKQDRAIEHDLYSAGVRSLVLLLAATLGALGASLLKARTERASGRRCPPLVLVGLASIPIVPLAAILARLGLGHSLATAGVVAFATMALLELASSNHAQANTDLKSPPTASAAAKALHQGRTIPHWLFAGHAWPFLLTLVFVIEKAFDVKGMSQLCVTAFRQRDLNMLMATTTVTALWLLLVEFTVQFHRSAWYRRRHSEGSP